MQSQLVWSVFGSMTASIQLYDLIKETFLLLDFGDRRLLEQFGLSISRYYTLVHIAADPGMSPSRLSTLMFCDKSNVTRLLHELEDTGLIERRPHERDGRAQRLFLTSHGAALRRRAAEAHQAYVAKRLSVLSLAERAELEALLARLNPALSQELAAACSTAADSGVPVI